MSGHRSARRRKRGRHQKVLHQRVFAGAQRINIGAAADEGVRDDDGRDRRLAAGAPRYRQVDLGDEVRAGQTQRRRIGLNVGDVVVPIVAGRDDGDVPRVGAGLGQRDRPRHAAGVGVDGHRGVHDMPLDERKVDLGGRFGTLKSSR